MIQFYKCFDDKNKQPIYTTNEEEAYKFTDVFESISMLMELKNGSGIHHWIGPNDSASTVIFKMHDQEKEIIIT